jgi:hypothetical protein
MTVRQGLFGAFLFLFLSCVERQSPAGETVTVAVPSAQLWAEPSSRSKAIAVLEKGQNVVFLGEVSAESSVQTLEGSAREGQWLKVMTSDRDSGWVFAEAVFWEKNASPQLEQALIDGRLRYFMGASLLARYRALRHSMGEVSREDSFASVFWKAIAFQRDLQTVFDEKLRKEAPTAELPDWLWLNAYLPGLWVQATLDGHSYRVYMDYRPWAALAKGTLGDADDYAIETLLQVFPEDSLEFEVPAWQLYDPQKGRFSLLGRGVHLLLLRRLDVGLLQGGSYREIYLGLLRGILEDLESADAFWESPDRFLSEYEAIRAENFSFWVPGQQLTLAVRYRQLTEWKKRGYRVDGYRGGSE